MPEALAVLPSLILGYLLWQAGKRADAAQDAFAAERAEWGKERRELLNRIQAPEKVVYEQFEPKNIQGHVPFDDDEAYWDSRFAHDPSEVTEVKWQS